MLEQIKRFDIASTGIEDLISMLAFGKLLQAEFEALDADPPEWLAPKLKAIRRAVQGKQADAIERKLANAKLQLENLKTPAERKAVLTGEIRKLEKMRDEVQ